MSCVGVSGTPGSANDFEWNPAMRSLVPAFAVTLFLGNPSALAEDFPGVQQLMSEQQFRKAGLHKLSEAEREALDHWLLTYTVGDAQALRRSNEAVQEAEESVRIKASIKPPFHGWDGNTVFHLDNGQVWRQRLRGHYAHHHEDSAVVISKNFLGFWEMRVTSSGKTVGVTRIK